MATEPLDDSESADRAWQEIEHLVNEIAELAQADVPESDFYQELLGRCVQTVAASGGAVWRCDANRRFELAYQIGLEATQLVCNETNRRSHARLLDAVSRGGRPRAIPPQSGQTGGHENENPSDRFLFICPIGFDGQPVGLVELFHRPGVAPAAQRGNLRLLEMLAELAVNYYRNRELRRLREREAARERLAEFARHVHRSLDLTATAYAIANEGRRLIGSDRVSVLLAHGPHYRLLAISGVDSFDRRANSVSKLEQLATMISAAKAPVWYQGDASSLPPQIERTLQAYLDETHARTLAVVPLADSAEAAGAAPAAPIGALVVEWFRECSEPSVPRSVAAVCGQSLAALRNASEVDRIPLQRFWRRLRGTQASERGNSRHQLAGGLFAAACAAVLLATIPIEFQVRAEGELQPLHRRNVFAPLDAEIVELQVAHDDEVTADQTLMVLRSSELDFELERVRGELETTLRRLEAVEAARVLYERQQEDDALILARLAAEESELMEHRTSLQQQLEILRRQHLSLQLQSPIHGRVLTWDVERLLGGRPVRRGQLLISMGEVDGPWILELQVPDDHIGHVLAARKETGQPQRVRFVLATDPGTAYWGQVRQFSGTVGLNDTDQRVVSVKVDIDREQIPLLRPGATVIAKIECGRRGAAFVWLHELIEAIQTWILF